MYVRKVKRNEEDTLTPIPSLPQRGKRGSGVLKIRRVKKNEEDTLSDTCTPKRLQAVYVRKVKRNEGVHRFLDTPDGGVRC